MSGNGGPDGSWSTPQDLVGTILADRYQVQKVIGEGGMGSVFLAEHVTLRKKVALKVLHPELCRDQTHVDRFLQEARAASMIQHENIVDIVDFGPVPGGSVFFAMEHLAGHDLAATLKQDGRMPWPRVQNFMLQIVRALKAAHGKGIIHRDLKPANCFVITKADGREFIKLLDFGIAKVTDSENDKGLTRTGAVFGTAKYMAPEQACGEAADNRTDIYAAAVLMYELLTGTVPFDGDNFMRVLSRHLTEPLTLPSTMAPDAGIPPMVESIVVKALSKKREDRYQDMGEFADALLALGPDGTLKAGGGMAGMAYAAPQMTNPPPRTGPPPPPGARPPPPPPSDAPGRTEWIGASGPGGLDLNSQPPEGRGGTLLLDGDSVPPEFMNQPGVQGPTGWGNDPAPPGGTLMLDGMGQDMLSGPGGAAITRNPPLMEGAPSNDPDTLSSDPGYTGTGDELYEEPSRKGFILLALGGAVAAIGLGGLVAWLVFNEPEGNTDASTTTPAALAQSETKEPADAKQDPVEVTPEVSAGSDGGGSSGGETEGTPAAGESSGGEELTLDGDDGDIQIEDDPDPTAGSEPKTNTTSKNRPKTPRIVTTRAGKDISKGFGRASKAAKQCGKTHGAIPGQSITVEAAIKSSGEILSANVSGPSRNSPLGKCVAKAVKSKARFVQSKQALQTGQRHTYKM